MVARTNSRSVRVGQSRLLFAGAAASIGTSTWLIIDRRPGWGGAAAGLAGVCLVVGASLSRGGGPSERILGAVVDRAFDGCVVAAIAWSTRITHPAISAGALIALAAGFLGAYIRARGQSLDYDVEESPITRGLRYGIVAVGLAVGWTGPAVYLAAGVSLLAAMVRASQVAKEERA